MRYNIGDRVKIREDLQPCEYYDEIYFNERMAEYRGDECIVSGYHTSETSETSDTGYYLKYDSGYILSGITTGQKWVFSDKMLEDIRGYYKSETTLDDILEG